MELVFGKFVHTKQTIMKKFIRWLVYGLSVPSIIIINFVLYHLIAARRNEHKKEVYEERLQLFKKETRSKF